MNKDNTVRQAGGFIIQLMPGASDEIIDLLESRLKGIDSMTAMLDRGMSPEDILGHILGELDLEINEKHDCSFYCGCTRERLEQALISTGRKELEEMIAEDKPIEMQCHFCGKKYEFSVEELTKLLEKAV